MTDMEKSNLRVHRDKFRNKDRIKAVLIQRIVKIE